MVQVLRPPHLSASALQSGAPWCDSPQALDELARRVDEGRISPELAPEVARYIADGYAVLRKAVPADLCTAIWADLDRHCVSGRPLLVSLHGQPGERYYDTAMDLRTLRFLHVDSVSEAARTVASCESIVAFIRALHDGRPLAMKVAAFPFGSQQRAHADLPFMPLRRPLRAVVAWLACEAIGPGSGNLFLVPGSHRWPHYDFGDDNVLIDGPLAGTTILSVYEAALEERIACHDMPPEEFTAAPGDLALFHPALVHGGLPVVDASASRRSLVCHYGVTDDPVNDWPWGRIVADGSIDRVAWG